MSVIIDSSLSWHVLTEGKKRDLYYYFLSRGLIINLETLNTWESTYVLTGNQGYPEPGESVLDQLYELYRQNKKLDDDEWISDMKQLYLFYSHDILRLAISVTERIRLFILIQQKKKSEFATPKADHNSPRVSLLEKRCQRLRENCEREIKNI